MASDVCKHCTHAGCLDVCPTGALFRTEFGTVVVQQDICNGCGYCVSACPYGVIDRRPRRRPRPEVHAVLRPAARRHAARLCPGVPDQSIQFGTLDELRERADRRLAQLHDAGVTEARLYGPTRTTGWAATARSSCCSTSRRCTGCRRTRVVPTRDARPCGARPAGGGGVRAGRDRGLRVGRGRGASVSAERPPGRNGHRLAGGAHPDADGGKTGPRTSGTEAQMFQGLQGGRPVDERAGHQDRRRGTGRRGGGAAR